MTRRTKAKPFVPPYVELTFYTDGYQVLHLLVQRAGLITSKTMEGRLTIANESHPASVAITLLEVVKHLLRTDPYLTDQLDSLISVLVIEGTAWGTWEWENRKRDAGDNEEIPF